MMEGYRNCWPLCLVILILYASCCGCYLSEARLHRQKPSAVVVGAVYCHTCLQDDISKGGHYISGATVAVECGEGRSRPAFQQEVKTDKQGKFKVKLPFSVSKHVNKIEEGCTVKLVKSSEPHCAVASTATSSLVHLKERKGGNHMFSAGYFSFKPLKQPDLCNQQPSKKNSLEDLLNPTIPIIMPDPETPTLPNPTTPTVPSVPTPPYPTAPETPFKGSKVDNDLAKQPQQLFPPIVPPVFTPPQGPIPLPPNPLQPSPLVPNPLQPPAPPLIPNPLQPPSPPPSLLPPLPPMPSLPPIPGLTPPVPTPPPASSLPLPPVIPLPPGLGGTPLIPGLPPLKAKKVNP